MNDHSKHDSSLSYLNKYSYSQHITRRRNARSNLLPIPARLPGLIAQFTSIVRLRNGLLDRQEFKGRRHEERR